MSEIVFNSSTPQSNLESQVESLQTTLASLNQRVYILQETLQEKDQEIAELQTKLADYNLIVTGSKASPCEAKVENRADGTLTIIGLLINLYRFVFPPGKEANSY